MDLLTLLQPAGAPTTGTPGSTQPAGSANGADGFEQFLFGLLAQGQAAVQGAQLGAAAAAKSATGTVAGATGTQPAAALLEAGGTALTGAGVLGIDGLLPSARSDEHILPKTASPLAAAGNSNPVTTALTGGKSSLGQAVSVAATAKTAAQAVATPGGVAGSVKAAATTPTSAAKGQTPAGSPGQQGAAAPAAGSAVTAALNEKSAKPGESANKPASPVAGLSEIVTAKTTIKSAVIDAPGAGKKSAAKTAGSGAKGAKTGGPAGPAPQAQNGLTVARAAQAAAKANIVKAQSSSGKSPALDLFGAAPASVVAAGGEGAMVVSLSSITPGAGAEPASHAAAARAAAPSTPVAQQVAVQFSQALANGTDRITIQLQPQSLGRVEVEIELTKEGRLTAIFIAERPETLEMLQRDSRALERALNEAGVPTDADGFSFSLRGEGRQAGQSDDSPGGSGGGREFGGIEGEERVTPRAAMLNANALLDIQV
jgi:flagellar hook-length control protein FliK